MTPLIAALVVQTPQDHAKYTQKVTSEVTLGYLISLPDGYDADRGKRWPVVFFLHGAGERGNDLEKNRVHGPFKEFAKGRKVPAIVVAPQCPAGEWWSNDRMLVALKGLFDHIERTYRIDRKREYLTGISMGGYGTWALGMRYPNRFAALAPICGNGDVSKVAAIREVPIWTVHGDSDPSVPVQGTRDLVSALRKSGSNVRYDEIAGGTHDVWTRMYAMNAFWEWMLTQRLS